MQVQVDIAFEQLVEIVKALPVKQLHQLKGELEKEVQKNAGKNDLESLLLNGPVATKKQIAVIEKNRKAMNQWRTK